MALIYRSGDVGKPRGGSAIWLDGSDATVILIEGFFPAPAPPPAQTVYIGALPANQVYLGVLAENVLYLGALDLFP